jgi:hypothetical protein
MKPEAAALLWTALVLLWLRPGLLVGIIPAIVFFEVFYLLSSLPILFLEQWPSLRPSSVPLTVLALGLLVGTIVYRFIRPRHSSPNERNS